MTDITQMIHRTTLKDLYESLPKLMEYYGEDALLEIKLIPEKVSPAVVITYGNTACKVY